MVKTVFPLICIGAFALVPVEAAPIFTKVALNGNYRLSGSASTTGFPASINTLLGRVPFIQDDSYGQVWNAAYDNYGNSTGNLVVTKTLSLNVADATGFYSLINTWWGQPAASGSFASITFTFSDSTSFTKNLYGNQDIRDFNYLGYYTRNINGTSTQNVYLNPGLYAIDRQWIDFSLYGMSGKTLTGVTFVDSGRWGFQRFLVSGATVQSGETGQVTGPALLPGEVDLSSIPEPSSYALLAMGGAAMFMVWRRRVA